MKVHASRRRKRVWWALAAGVVLTIAIAGTTLPLRVPPAVAELAVARGGVERFVPDDARWEALPSGAQLDAGARLRTSPDGGAAFVVLRDLVVRADGATEWIFDDATHLTLTGGTLYVDTGSAGSAGRALQIVTPHGVVRHVGTQYEVRALSSELRVRVREGRVQLEPRAAGPARETAAGEELLLMADGAVALRPFAADSPEWQWAEALAVRELARNAIWPSTGTVPACTGISWAGSVRGRMRSPICISCDDERMTATALSEWTLVTSTQPSRSMNEPRTRRVSGSRTSSVVRTTLKRSPFSTCPSPRLR
jgi:hypothetical protein